MIRVEDQRYVQCFHRSGIRFLGKSMVEETRGFREVGAHGGQLQPLANPMICSYNQRNLGTDRQRPRFIEGTILVVFALIRAIPGDASMLAIGFDQRISDEQRARVRESYGLDESQPVRHHERGPIHKLRGTRPPRSTCGLGM